MFVLSPIFCLNKNDSVPCAGLPIVKAGKIVNVIVVSKGTFIPGFCPRMGLAVGHLLNAEFTYSQEGACSFDCSALPNADRKYCFNGVNGYYGLMVNSTIGSTPGQNGP